MTATKTWHCHCCGEAIEPGESFEISAGTFLKSGHSEKDNSADAKTKLETVEQLSIF